MRCVADGWGSLKGSQRLRKVIKKPFLLTTARPYDSFPDTCRRRRFVLILIWFILHTHEPSIQTDRADRGQVEDLGRILLNGSARDIVAALLMDLVVLSSFYAASVPVQALDKAFKEHSHLTDFFKEALEPTARKRSLRCPRCIALAQGFDLIIAQNHTKFWLMPADHSRFLLRSSQQDARARRKGRRDTGKGTRTLRYYHGGVQILKSHVTVPCWLQLRDVGGKKWNPVFSCLLQFQWIPVVS